MRYGFLPAATSADYRRRGPRATAGPRLARFHREPLAATVDR